MSRLCLYTTKNCYNFFWLLAQEWLNRASYTLRAFMNQKFDLTQAEAVADLIASENSASPSNGYDADERRV